MRGVPREGSDAREERGPQTWLTNLREVVRRAPWLPGLLLVLLFLAVALTRFTEIERLMELVRGVAPSWIILGVILQAATYVCTPILWMSVLHRAGSRTRLGPLLPLSLAKLFLDQAVPSGGVSGTALVVRGLQRRGIPTPIALAAVLVDLLSYYAAYVVGVLITLVVLVHREHLEGFIIGLLAFFVVMIIAVPLVVFALMAYGRRTRRPRWARFRSVQKLLDAFGATPPHLVRNARLLALGAVLRLTIFALDAATLAVMLRALGHVASPGTVYAAFLLGTVAATISPFTAGLGTFEAATVGTLALLDVRTEEALAATVLLRLFTFWIPMLPGLMLARRELRPT